MFWANKRRKGSYEKKPQLADLNIHTFYTEEKGDQERRSIILPL